MSDAKWYLSCDPNWIRILKYIRTVSGRVYEDQVRDMLKKWAVPGWSEEMDQPIDFLNNYPLCCPGFDSHWDHEFLKMDWRTGGIYTVPGIRALLDPAIFSVDSKYVYNRFLYTESFQEGIEQLKAEGASVRKVGLADVSTLCQESVFSFDGRHLHMDFSSCTDGCTSFLLFQDFDLQQIYREVCKHFSCTTDVSIGRLDLRYLLFAGRTSLNLTDLNITLDCGIGLDGITCQGPFEMHGLTFRFPGTPDPEGKYDWCQIALRNARFFDRVQLRDIRLSGAAQGTAVSFEDARISKNLNLENMDFGDAALFCFQTVLGNFLRNPFVQPVKAASRRNEKHRSIPVSFAAHRLRLLNASFGAGSRIDFADAEISCGEILFENIDNLPPSGISLAPNRAEKDMGCPRVHLLIRNCNINNPLSIGNVEKLSFLHSHNYSYIEASSEWQSSPFWQHLRTAGPGGTPIINKLLLAVYNNTPDTYPFDSASNGKNLLGMAKARDFIMLKSNFAACNLYDEEDVAFILYMEYKPIINSIVIRGKNEHHAKADFLSNAVYRFLYATGKYGISPMRVILSLILLVLCCTGLYFIAACLVGELAFSTGGTDAGNLHYASTVWDKLLSCFLYSIEGVIPFVSQFEPLNFWVCVVTILENAMGTFLTGYFSVAVIRKTLH